MFSKLLIVMTAAVVVVNAQDSASGTVTSSPSTPSQLTPCILACIQPAAAQNGCAFTDVQCVCTSAQFQADAGACLQQHCSATDLQSALALQNAECAAVSLSATGASVTPNSVSFTLASSAASGSATATGTSLTTVATTATGTTSGTPSATSTATTPTGTTATTAAPSTTSKAAASSLVANSGMGAIAAIIAGFLAL